MKAMKFLVVFCLVLITNGFQVLGQTEKVSKPDEKNSSTAQNLEIKGADDNVTAMRNRLEEKYRIGYQDALEVTVAKHAELSLPMINVSPDGTIILPRISGPIVAVCKTERELSEHIKNLYKSYLKDPFVSVRVVEQRSQPVAVIGAVEKPGAFNLNRKLRLLELLAYAGGPKVEDAGANIQVARVGSLTGCADNTEEEDKVEFFTYKINDVMSGKENPLMKSGDIVSVLEAEQAYVVGNVVKPETIKLKNPYTLTEAIAYAGGLAPEAKTNKVRIQRQTANSSVRTELVFDLKDIKEKKISDPIIQPNDIVEVPKDGVKALRNGFLKALGGGISNLFYGVGVP